MDAYNGDEFDGRTLTLDTALRRVTVSDGRVLHLVTAEQVQRTLEAFLAVVEGDPTMDDFDDISMSDIYPVSSEECEEDDGTPKPDCYETVRADGLGSARRSRRRHAPDQRVRTDEVVLARRVVVGGAWSSKREVANPRDYRSVSPASDQERTLAVLKRFDQFAALTQEEYDMCGDIVSAAIPQSISWPVKRSNWLIAALRMGITEVINGVAGKYLPPGSSLAAEFDLAAADLIQARIAVGFLAGLWNSYDCSSKKVRASQKVTLSTGGQPYGGQTLKCAWETWEISFDGGYTWFPVQIETCRWRLPE